MKVSKIAKKWLGSVFERSQKPADTLVYPGDRAPLKEHVAFLLKAKAYIAAHPVPDKFKNHINQYSHAGKTPITDSIHDPAITNCSYTYFNSKLISVGFPRFIKQEPLIKDNQFNPAFNGATFWDSFQMLLKHKIPEIAEQGDNKYGFYIPTNHYYIERRVSNDVYERAQPIIDFFTRTCIQDAETFLKKLDEHLAKNPAITAPAHRV